MISDFRGVFRLSAAIAALVLVHSCGGGGGGGGASAPTLPLPPHLKALNPGAGDNFGSSIALSRDGNTLAIGAFQEDSAATGIGGDPADDTAASAGAVYVFTRDASSGDWSLQAYVKASNTQGADRFGVSVALSGDGNTLAVGANEEDSAATGIDGDEADNTAENAGAAYVFARSGATWVQQAYIKASNTETFDNFGLSVALSGDGDTLAVGSLGEDSAATGIDGDQADNTVNAAGAVYVFTRGGTTWAQQAYIKASNPGEIDRFGFFVTLSGDGDTIAVAADRESSAATGIDGDQTDDTAPSAGAVYVFTRSGATWAQQAYVKASNTGASDFFGISIALSGDGDTLAVGANGEDSAATGIGGDQADNMAANAGAVYVFARSGTTWTQQAYVKASNAERQDQFGGSVALSGDGNTLAVGAGEESSAATGIGGNQADNTAGGAGAVYVFTRSGAAWTQQSYVKASNSIAGYEFGGRVSLSSAGDKLASAAKFEEGISTSGDPVGGAGAVYVYALQ